MLLPTRGASWDLENNALGIHLNDAGVAFTAFEHAAGWAVLAQATVHFHGRFTGQIHTALDGTAVDGCCASRWHARLHSRASSHPGLHSRGRSHAGSTTLLHLQLLLEQFDLLLVLLHLQLRAALGECSRC